MLKKMLQSGSTSPPVTDIAHVKLTSELYYILYTILYLLISMNLSIIWAAFVCGFVNIFCDVKKISKLIFWILKRKLL